VAVLKIELLQPNTPTRSRWYFATNEKIERLVYATS